MKRGIEIKNTIILSLFFPPIGFFLLGCIAAKFDENRALDKKVGDLYTYIKNERLKEDKGILK
ncbi:MAG: hypothetical protein ACOCUI_02665 [bacterium]